jgi:hypothetical protein
LVAAIGPSPTQVLQLVQQPGSEVLLEDVGAAPNPDVLLAGGGPGLLKGRLDSVAGEDVGGTALFGWRLGRFVGDHEDRLAERRRVYPWPDSDVEHSLADHDRPVPA